MAKSKTQFVCSACGYETVRWLGKCPGCSEWNTLTEELIPAASPAAPAPVEAGDPPMLLEDIPKEDTLRMTVGIQELDRVLGGGLVSGSLILLGGDPGIGKSTLLLQVCDILAQKGMQVLYISGEESARQIRMRATRLGVSSAPLYVLAETNIDAVMAHMAKLNPDMVIVDSIQTTYLPRLSSAPGSVSQVRESAAQFLRWAKGHGCTVFLVGHVTKEGAIAGPRILEHMVDTVLYFEGDRHQQFRIVRAVKNRFGSTNEIGVFQMRQEGMIQVKNPSEMLLSGGEQDRAGQVVFCSMEGTRPVLVEIQSLVSQTVFGMPRRMGDGVDYNRMVLLLAVMEKKCGLILANQDVYANVAGGLKLNEPAMDLALIAAVASGFRNKPLGAKTAVMGEVGLTGEVRAVSQIEARLAECAKLGMARCIVPKASLRGLTIPEGMDVRGVADASHALQLLGLS